MYKQVNISTQFDSYITFGNRITKFCQRANSAVRRLGPRCGLRPTQASAHAGRFRHKSLRHDGCRYGSATRAGDGRHSQDCAFCQSEGSAVCCRFSSTAWAHRPMTKPMLASSYMEVDSGSSTSSYTTTAGQIHSWQTNDVNRLSRPSLAVQHPLPNSRDLGISPKASLAYPTPDDANDQFVLSPVLNLPEAFGSAYVGETFSCTLCANNELDPADNTKAISGVRIQGDMQTPSNPTGSPLDLSGLQGEVENASPGPAESLQRILRFELKEEGNHVLAVTVTYTETALGEGRAASGRVRTFRKLYQFVAQQLLSVRTKAGEMGPKNGCSRYLLEAQLENMGEAAVCLEVRQRFQHITIHVPVLFIYSKQRVRPCGFDLKISAPSLARSQSPIRQWCRSGAISLLQIAYHNNHSPSRHQTTTDSQ